MSCKPAASAGDHPAESLARIMLDRLTSRATQELGVIDSADIAQLNAQLEMLPVPEGTTIDTAATGYAITRVEHRHLLPHDQEPLRVVTDQPRSDYDVLPDVRGVRAARAVEVAIVATVHNPPLSSRSVATRVEVAKVLPHRRAIQAAGDLEICVSGGSKLLVDGRISSVGRVISACAGDRVITGQITASEAVVVQTAAGGTHLLRTPSGDIILETITREEIQSDVAGTIAAYGGRVTVASGLGGRLYGTRFQTAKVAGSGECPDFEQACNGRSHYYPSITLQKSSNAGSDNFSVSCGAAYKRAGDPVGCISQMRAAVEYVPYPFAGTQPTGTARTLPDGTYWQGLFPDPRRETRCTATVDGTNVSTFRCDTNAYGYVINLAVLGTVEGGLLSIRKTDNGAGTNNPSGWQEVVLLKNADVLYGPLTIHSELPVYIAGNFNSYEPRPAMIQAPAVTLLPATFNEQVDTRSLWDSTAVVEPEPFRESGRVEIHAILRTHYQPRVSGAYYGGAIEGVPHVLGDWNTTDLLVEGAIEVIPWTSGDPNTYASAHRPLGTAPAPVRTHQPATRIVRFDESYLNIDYQPPGSWSPANQPVGQGPNAPRTAERQKNAAGGLAAVVPVQIPTRIPPDSAVSLVADQICDESNPNTVCTDDPGTEDPPVMLDVSCAPNPAVDGTAVSCDLSASAGDYPVAEFEVDWDDGNVSNIAASGGSATATHTFPMPGTYTVRVRAVDSQFVKSQVMTAEVEITIRPPRITASCSPTVVKPDQPDGNGDFTDCTITATEGSYAIDRHIFDWGDGASTTTQSASLVVTESHKYDAEGDYWVAMHVVDIAGYASNVDSVKVTARHVPPRITDFDCTPSPAEPTETVTCTGTVEDGTTAITQVTVNWGDGTTGSATLSGTQFTATHAYHTGTETAASDRSYTVTATAEDMASYQDTAQTTVQIQTVLPTVSMTCTRTSFYEGESTDCTVTSTEGTFAVESVHFDWDDGSAVQSVSGTQATRTHTYTNPGSYLAQGWATDSRGNESTRATVSLTVEDVVLPGSASFTSGGGSCPDSAYINDQITCTASANPGTYPIDSFIFTWESGATDTVPADNGTGTDSETYGLEGTYTVSAQACDTKGNCGASGSDVFEVVQQVAPSIETFSCTPGTVLQNETSTCSATADGGSGTIESYTYSCDDGSGAKTVYTSNTSTSFSCSWSTTGMKQLWIKVTNSLGDASKQVTFDVTVGKGEVSLSCPASATMTQPFTCTATVTDATPESYTFYWDDVGSSSTVNTTSATTDSASFTYPANETSGSHTIRVVASFTNNTTAQAEKPIDVVIPPPYVACSASDPEPNTISEIDITILYEGDRDLNGQSPYIVTDVTMVVEKEQDGSTTSVAWTPNNESGTIEWTYPPDMGSYIVTVTSTHERNLIAQNTCYFEQGCYDDPDTPNEECMIMPTSGS